MISLAEIRPDIKISINQNDLKTRFELMNNCDIKYNIQFVLPTTTSIMFTMGWVLGFRMGQYINIKDTLASEGLFDGGGDRYIYVSLVDFNKNRNDNHIIFLDNSFIDKDIIGKVYLHEGKFSINIEDADVEGSIKKREFNGPVDFEKMHIKLLDEYGNTIYLNNMDYSLSLEFEVVYENYSKNLYN